MRHFYDDPVAYRRRWDRLSESALGEAASADPLLFLADHIPLADRSRGSLGLFTRVLGAQTAVLIPGAEPDLDADGCLTAMGGFVGKLCEDAGREDFEPGDAPVVEALGIVHHRTGAAHVTDLDRWWAQALATVCEVCGIEPLGVIARTQSGAVVRVPLPPEALRKPA